MEKNESPAANILGLNACSAAEQRFKPVLKQASGAVDHKIF